MIDLHCHILPALDDGAETLEESLKMANMAVNEGITHILATPHHMNRNWINEKEKVITLVNEFQEELDKRKIPLTIFPGQEIRIYGEIQKDIEENKILFIDEFQQYLLIEFPTQSIPTYTERLFYELEAKGITPIIVHPERNREIQEHPNRLKTFVDKGALAQLTAASYTGGFGKKIQKISKQFVEANLVHFLASDAHNITSRAYHMKDAYKQLEQDYGNELVENYKKRAKDLINGEIVISPTPSLIKKKRFWGIF